MRNQGNAGEPPPERFFGLPSVRLPPRTIMLLLISTNLLNYVDRGIIPGAYGAFDSFINRSHELAGTSHTSMYFGLLQSAFVVGFSVAGVVFGNIIHATPPFRVVGAGLLAWCAAAALAGLARAMRSYAVLLLARALSGVGEAGFQIVGGPFIQDHAPRSTQGKWLGAYRGDPGRHRARLRRRRGALQGGGLGVVLLRRGGRDGADRARVPSRSPRAFSLDPAAGEEVAPISFGEEIALILRRPVFVLVTCGYAAYAACVMGFSTFGPAFAIGLGFFDDAVSASLALGAVVSLSGLVGTVLGGMVLDVGVGAAARRCRGAAEPPLATLAIPTSRRRRRR